MFNIFTDQLELFDCIFDIDVDGSKQIQQMQAPRIMIQQQFLQLVQQAGNDGRAVKIVLRRDAPCYDEFNKKWITREHEIEFKNKLYLDKEESN